MVSNVKHTVIILSVYENWEVISRCTVNDSSQLQSLISVVLLQRQAHYDYYGVYWGLIIYLNKPLMQSMKCQQVFHPEHFVIQSSNHADYWEEVCNYYFSRLHLHFLIKQPKRLTFRNHGMHNNNGILYLLRSWSHSSIMDNNCLKICNPFYLHNLRPVA